MSTQLVKAGQYQKARELLQEPLAQPLEGAENVEIIGLIEMCRVPYAYYQEADFPKTRAAVEAVVARYQTFQAAHPQLENDYGLAGEVTQAQLYLDFIEHWKAAPLRVLPAEVKLPLESVGGLPQATTKRLSLRTFRRAQFTVQSESPYLGAELTSGDWTGERRHYSEQELTLKIDPALLPPGKGDLATAIVITMKGEKPYTLRVPVTIARG